MKNLGLFVLAACFLIQANAQGWIEIQKIVDSDRVAGSGEFGHSVATSGDDVMVGARNDGEDTVGGNWIANAGSAYFFERDSGSQWTEVQKIVAL